MSNYVPGKSNGVSRCNHTICRCYNDICRFSHRAPSGTIGAHYLVGVDRALACILLCGCPILIFFSSVCVVFGPLVFSPENGGGGKAPLAPPPLDPRLPFISCMLYNELHNMSYVILSRVRLTGSCDKSQVRDSWQSRTEAAIVRQEIILNKGMLYYSQVFH